MKNGRLLCNGYFPVWVCTWAALLRGEVIGWVLVDKHIVSAWEQLCKRNEVKVRPVVRSPSVPVGSAIMPKTPIASWA